MQNTKENKGNVLANMELFMAFLANKAFPSDDFISFNFR